MVDYAIRYPEAVPLRKATLKAIAQELFLLLEAKAEVKVTPDERVFSGETVTLTCDIQGAGNDTQWTYSWFKDGSIIPNSTERVYNITFNVSDSGQYSCEAKRSHISVAVTLTVSDFPRSSLTVTPESPVFTGETVTLTCVIESYNFPRSTLTVTPDSPVFTGETFNLTCVIETHSEWKWRNGLKYDRKYDWTYDWRYEWYKDTYSRVMLNTSDRYTVNRDTLTIRGANESDQGQYWCRGQRDERPTSSHLSSAVNLTVIDLHRTVLTMMPDNPVFTGETVNLTCGIKSNHSNWTEWTNNLRYEWYKDTDRVKLNTSDRYTVNRDTLTIRGVNESDQDWYWCRGQRDGEPSRPPNTSVYLYVMARPKAVLKVTPDERVFSGETVTLTCDIQGAGHIQWTYSWFRNGSFIRDVTERLYSITSVSDRAEYSCRGERSDSQRSSDISSAVTLTVSDLKPKPELTSDPEGAALTGNTVTLICHMNPATGWDFYWYKHTLNSETKTQTNSYRVTIDSVSDGGQYWCRAGRGKPVYYTQYSDALWINVTVSPKAVVTVRPDEQVFRGETVTLRCDIKWSGNTEWTYRWETEGTDYQNNSISTQELNISSVKDSHSGKYSCRGEMGTQRSQRSDAVTLTVSAGAQAAVRVSPQPWLTEGDSVTLICEVTGSSTGWTFSWFRDDDRLSDSSRGAGGSYTLSPAALQHTGVYTCRAERGRPAYYTKTSNTERLWITGDSPSVHLVVSPSRSQHFSSDSLSLSCEDQWTVRRYTGRNTEDCSKQTGSTCRLVSLSTSDSGVYWCQSESGEKRHPLNITVHDGDVILESSVDPVIEGDTLTLHCLHRSTNPSILRAFFYKDGFLVQSQTTGEISITTVSESDEGFYYCKTERGESLRSWISVREGQTSVFSILSFLLAACPYLLSTVVLLFKCYRARVPSAEDQSQYEVKEETST
ncbi:B-cell receptor CD22-like [Carassius gibelio]|uniref:B-cell receptor CD22-like n=1 Tax=Carassius gibelio TaxID=101364 RepID=UPI002277CBDD|nr:B-cell receptor CD22-like [Carassius gibelio]